MLGSCLEFRGADPGLNLRAKVGEVEVVFEEVWELLLSELLDISSILVAKKGGPNVPIIDKGGRLNVGLS